MLAKRVLVFICLWTWRQEWVQWPDGSFFREILINEMLPSPREHRHHLVDQKFLFFFASKRGWTAFLSDVDVVVRTEGMHLETRSEPAMVVLAYLDSGWRRFVWATNCGAASCCIACRLCTQTPPRVPLHHLILARVTFGLADTRTCAEVKRFLESWAFDSIFNRNVLVGNDISFPAQANSWQQRTDKLKSDTLTSLGFFLGCVHFEMHLQQHENAECWMGKIEIAVIVLMQWRKFVCNARSCCG